MRPSSNQTRSPLCNCSSTSGSVHDTVAGETRRSDVAVAGGAAEAVRRQSQHVAAEKADAPGRRRQAVPTGVSGRRTSRSAQAKPGLRRQVGGLPAFEQRTAGALVDHRHAPRRGAGVDELDAVAGVQLRQPVGLDRYRRRGAVDRQR